MGKKSLVAMRNSIEREERRWNIERGLIERQNKIDAERKELKESKPRYNMSKLLIMFLFINCTLIEIFTCIVTVKMLTVSMMTGVMIDFTPLVALIASVVGEVIGYGIYSLKATKENTKNGIVYETALREKAEIEQPIDDGITDEIDELAIG